MYQFKIYRGVLCHDNEEWYQIGWGIDLSIQNWHDEFDKIGLKHTKISKIGTLRGCFSPKYIMFALKNYRGLMFDNIEDSCKIWRKTGLRFLKISVYSLKNCNFILESKMAELNWRQNLLIYFENFQDVPYSHE